MLKMITISLSRGAVEDMVELAKWLKDHGYEWADGDHGVWVVSKGELSGCFVKPDKKD